MGIIADSIIDGEICALCMSPFKENHGYPVACKSCYSSNCGYQKATYSTLTEQTMEKNLNRDSYVKGGMNYKKTKTPTTGVNAINGVIQFIKGKGMDEDDLRVVVERYVTANVDKNLDTQEGCDYIQRDFGAFVKWFKLEYNKK